MTQKFIKIIFHKLKKNEVIFNMYVYIFYLVNRLFLNNYLNIFTILLNIFTKSCNSSQIPNSLYRTIQTKKYRS